MDIELGQVVSQILAFLIMLGVLKLFAWKPLLNLLEERRNRIQGEFDKIDNEKIRLNDLRKEYDKKFTELEVIAKKMGQEEVQRARKQALEIQEEAQKHAREIINHAQLLAKNELVYAKKTLKKDMAKLIVESLKVILPQELDQEKNEKLISTYLEKVDLN